MRSEEKKIADFPIWKRLSALSLADRIMLYILMMLAAIAVRRFITNNVVVVSAVSLFGLFLLFAPLCQRPAPRVEKLILLYFLCCLATFLANLRFLSLSLSTWGTMSNIVVAPLFVLVLAAAGTTHPLGERDLRRVLLFLSLTGIVSACITWVMDWQDILAALQGSYPYRRKLYGFFNGKNIYANYVMISMAADWYFLEKDEDDRWLISLFLKCVALVFSFSRTAMLEAGVLLAFLFCTKKRTKKKDIARGVVVLAILLGVGLWAWMTPQTHAFLVERVLRLQVKDAGRSREFASVLRVLLRKPRWTILGIGYAGMTTGSIDSDNTWLYCWLSGGLFKLVFFAAALFASLRRILAWWKRDALISRICLGVFLCYLIFSCLEQAAVLELGPLNFMYTLFMYLIPFGLVAEGEER